MQMSPSSTSKALTITPQVMDRMRASLWGLYIGDALAMPTHWCASHSPGLRKLRLQAAGRPPRLLPDARPALRYYDQSHLRRTYGQIKGYVKPEDKLPGSIMSLSNTGGGGRGGTSGDIVGGVILKGKKQFWERGGNWFYHRGMASGENTLECVITRLITKARRPHLRPPRRATPLADARRAPPGNHGQGHLRQR